MALHHHETVESVGNEDRNTTIVEVFDLGLGDSDEKIPLIKLVADLQRVLSEIPEQHRDSAYLHVRAYGDYASAYADVKFHRPETDEEFTERQRWLKGLDEEREARDQREFARLRQKYADGSS
jgi:hypothetical protein